MTARHLLPALLSSLLLLSGCSTPASRIESHRAEFAGYPPAVQEKIRAGRVDLGFTPEQVRLALGEPLRKVTRSTATGDSEEWVYGDNGPHFSFGLGMAGGGGHTAVGGGVAMTSGGYAREERMRVEFKAGVVSAIDYARY
jgi:hypothetical protein